LLIARLNILFLISIGIVNVCAQPSQQEIITGIKAGLRHDYELALDIFNTNSHNYPEDPIGPFLTASILDGF